MDQKKLEVPEQSADDLTHSALKAGLSAIPVIGGAAAELFQHVFQSPLEKRRSKWMEQVGEKIQELEGKGLDIDDLQENEQFISAAMYASQLALRTHKQEKLEALRNAVINTATGQAPEETLQHMFLNFVDTMTELHIQILKIFQSPTPPPGMGMGALSHVLEHNMPSLSKKQELYDQLWKDLYTRGLVSTDNIHRTTSGSGLARKQTTGLGDTFLSFISEPK